MSKESDAVNSELESKAKQIYKVLQRKHIDVSSKHWTTVNNCLDEAIATIELYGVPNTKDVN